jgi:biopolymer transport protein ExbD
VAADGRYNINRQPVEGGGVEILAREIIVAVAADGRYNINRQPVEGGGVEILAAALQTAAQGDLTRPVIISADAMAAHQSVINVMDAARRVGLVQLTFATQSSRAGGSVR